MKGKTLYLECATGISGDMTVAALLDLGASAETLDRVLRSLHLDGFQYAVSRRSSYGMAGCDFDVALVAESGHCHEHHEQEHHHHGHHHEHRNLADVYAIIDRGEMSDRARALAKRIFLIVAEAEAEAHGKPVEEVHFHEVGAVDSIVDIVSAAVCVDDLGIEACVVTGLTEGAGTVRCQHGELPVPVPAVANIARRFALPIRIRVEACGELVTPTGIAIAAALRTRDVLPEVFSIERIGVGLGKRDFGFPNFLRMMLIDVTVVGDAGDRVWVVESNIDDCTGEQLGFAAEAIVQAGAKDVHYVPCFMKKSRPAYLLRIIVAEDRLMAVEDAVFRNTTTIGLRKHPVTRICLEREIVPVTLPCGTIEVKRCRWQGGYFDYPEYESVKRVAEEIGVDFKTIFDQAKRQIGVGE